MKALELDYFNGQSLSPTMPIQNGSPSWMLKRRWTWAVPEQIMFALRSAHWLRFETRLRKAAREHRPDIHQLRLPGGLLECLGPAGNSRRSGPVHQPPQASG
jgi:hypothetical protein